MRPAHPGSGRFRFVRASDSRRPIRMCSQNSAHAARPAIQCGHSAAARRISPLK
jgi:hypothetical protein